MLAAPAPCGVREREACGARGRRARARCHDRRAVTARPGRSFLIFDRSDVNGRAEIRGEIRRVLGAIGGEGGTKQVLKPGGDGRARGERGVGAAAASTRGNTRDECTVGTWVGATVGTGGGCSGYADQCMRFTICARPRAAPADAPRPGAVSSATRSARHRPWSHCPPLAATPPRRGRQRACRRASA